METTEELSKLKERLAAAEAKAAMLDCLPTPVIQLDQAGTIAYLNPAGAAVLGLNRQHVIGMHCHNVLQTPQCRTGQCLCQQAVTCNTTITGETVVDPAGLNIPIRFSGNPVEDALGNPIGAVVTLVDIRNEVELKQEFLHLKTAVLQGDLTLRGDAEKFTGQAQELLRDLNAMLDAVAVPLKLATAYAGRIAKGDLPAKITTAYAGEFDELKNNLNHWLEVCHDLLSDVHDLGQAVARGKLAIRADLTKYQGDWAVALKDVNMIVETMGAPIREIGKVLDKMAAGDFKARAAADYLGEYQALKLACNELGHHLMGVREMLADVQTAIVNGQLAARGNPHQFKGELTNIVQSFNAVLDTVVGPFKLMNEYVAHFAQGTLPARLIDEYKGDFNGMKLNLNSVIDTLQGLTNAADAIANGDLSIQFPKRTEEDRLMRAFQQIVGNFRQFTAEIDHLADLTSAGRLDVRGNVGALKGDWAKSVRRVNAMLDAVIRPLNLAAEYVERLAGGAIPAKITDEYQGDFDEIKNSLNRCIEAFQNLSAETANMAEAAARGEWGRRGDASKYAGGWAVIVRGFNQTVEHLIAPLLDISSVFNRLADGDLSARLTTDCQGDYNALRLACNGLREQLQGVQAGIEQLKSSAAQGKFAVRSETRQLKGEFAEMVQHLNNLSDGLHGPLDMLAERLAALAKGIIPERMTGQHKGTFQTIKNELNAVIEILAEASRFAEQMAHGKFPTALKERSAQDTLSRALNTMQGTIRQVLQETHTHLQAVQSGRLDARGNADALPGSWRELVNDVNSVVETFTFPLQNITPSLDRLAQGDIPEKITGEYKGAFNKLRTTVNTMIDGTSAVMQLAQEIANGNRNVTVTEYSDRDMLRQTLKKMVSTLQNGNGGTVKTAALLEKNPEPTLPELAAAIVPDFDQEVVNHSLHQMMTNFQSMMGEMEKSVSEVQQQTWLRAGQTELSRILRKEQDDAALAKALIAFLVKYVKAQVGAFYLAQPEQETVMLRLAGSYAYHKRKGNKIEFMLGEGLVGQAALEQESILFADIPEDYMWVASGLGKTPLRYLLATPLMYAGELKGVIELGTVHEFSELHLNFLEQIREHVALALHAAQTREHLRKPAETLRQQTQELDRQQEQLQTRTAELEAQARRLQQSEETLARQQAQLQHAQAELTAQARTVHEAETSLRQQQASFQLSQAELQSRTWALQEERQALRQQQEQFQAGQAELQSRTWALQEERQTLRQEQEQLRASQAELARQSQAFQESAEIRQQQQVSDQERQAELNVQAAQLHAAEQALAQQQEQLRLRQEELETQSQAVRQFEQTLRQQREQFQQKEAELARRGNELEKQRAALQEKALALEKTHQMVKEEIRELDLAGKYKPEFITNLSQKLRASFNRLLILSNLLIENKDRNLTDRQVEFARNINVSVTKLLAAINEALHLAKVETGKIELRLEELDVQGLANVIEQNFARIAAEKGLELKIDLAAGLPATIQTDRQHLEHIVKRLLSNAFKFTEQGCVSVRVSEFNEFDEFVNSKAQKLRFEFADTGIGIPKDKQRVIFEAFQQVDNALTRKYAGIGLGLSIARGLARLLGGDITVTSQEGHGSTFTLTLPESLPAAQETPFPEVLAEEAEPPAAAPRLLENGAAAPTSAALRPRERRAAEPAAPLPPMPAATPKTVIRCMLIVENDSLTLMSILEVLNGRGVEVTTVENGQDAYRQLQATHFDCLILDLNLTDIAGVELLDMIAEDALIAPLPIIVYADRPFTSQEKQLCQRYPKSSLLIEVNSPEKLLAEISLLLQPAAPVLPVERQAEPHGRPRKDTVLDQKIILMVTTGPHPDPLTGVLREKGLQILPARNGEEVWEQLTTHPDVDLVLIDLTLPDMNGYEVTRKIRQEPCFMKLPIIALTGAILDDDRQKCLAAGVNDYLAKPVDPDELLSLLRVWLY